MNISNHETVIANTPANSSGLRSDEATFRVSNGATRSPLPVNTDDLSTQTQVILPDTTTTNNSNRIRELYSTLLNTTNDLDQSMFNDVFQNILMESTDAPPNISNTGVDSIPNIRPLIMSLLQNSLSSSIESIDITYTVDYDISNN